MKKTQLLLATISLPIDYLALILAGLSAYFLRFESSITDIIPIRFYLPLGEYFSLILVVGAGWIILFALSGLYQTKTRVKLADEFKKIFLACSTGLALIVIWFFFDQALFSSRFIVLASWMLAIIYCALGRTFVYWLKTKLYKHDIGVNRVLIIGSGESADVLHNLFISMPEFGFRSAGIQNDYNEGNLLSKLGEINGIVLADTNLSSEIKYKLWQFCIRHHLNFRYVADVFNAQSHNIVFHTWAGLPIVEIKKTPLEGWGRVAKRLFDIVFSFSALIILSPLFIFFSLIILVLYGRPIFASLERVGENGEHFKLHKFRSMVNGAEQMKSSLMSLNERKDGPLFKITNDPRVLPFGKFTRRWSLDELAQLWDVFIGTMSLVGPRPHEPQEVAQYSVDHYKLLNIKPGITGLAQISGRSGLAFEQEARLDSLYIENWSLLHDVIILVKTVVVIFRRQHAV